LERPGTLWVSPYVVDEESALTPEAVVQNIRSFSSLRSLQSNVTVANFWLRKLDMSGLIAQSIAKYLRDLHLQRRLGAFFSIGIAFQRTHKGGAYRSSEAYEKS
jgi:hypothetical protein